MTWEYYFEIWWGISIKYFCPFALFWLLMLSLHNDVHKVYGGYNIFWQYLGFCFPLTGTLIFILCVLFCTTPEPFDHDIDAAFDEDDIVGTGLRPFSSDTGQGNDREELLKPFEYASPNT